MSYNALKLCKEKDGYYEVDPAVMFPATIARIKECVVSEPPTEIVTPGWPGRPDREAVANRFLEQAESFTPEAWSLAAKPFSEFKAGDPALALRAEVLGLAESWFKRALALAVGHGIRVHIAKNLDYKR